MNYGKDVVLLKAEDVCSSLISAEINNRRSGPKKKHGIQVHCIVQVRYGES